VTTFNIKSCSFCTEDFTPTSKQQVRCRSCRGKTTAPHSAGYCCVCNWSKREEFSLTCASCKETKPARKRLHRRINAFVGVAVKLGLIPSPKAFQCVDCGQQACCWEHRDYNKPFEVEPTCKSCDKKRGEGKTISISGFLDTSKFKRIPIKKGK